MEGQDDPQSSERGQYSFLQAMVREVPYGTLAREDRRARHLAADDLEGEDGAEELSGIAAWHLLDVLGATTAAQNPAHEEVVLQAIQRMTLAPSAF